MNSVISHSSRHPMTDLWHLEKLKKGAYVFLLRIECVAESAIDYGGRQPSQGDFSPRYSQCRPSNSRCVQRPCADD